MKLGRRTKARRGKVPRERAAGSDLDRLSITLPTKHCAPPKVGRTTAEIGSAAGLLAILLLQLNALCPAVRADPKH